MDKPEFRVERGPAATDEAFAIGMAKLLEREGRTIAAAELRRLHAENERLKTMPMKYRRMEFNAQLQAENDGLRAQRDALLEALKYHQEQTRPIQRTLDVIKAVEEGK